MIELFSASPLMSVFLVVALGAVLGSIPLGSLRLGAAGALFVGLVVGYFVPELGAQLALIQQLGLALFVYCVGLSAGQTFFSDIKSQYKLMLSSLIALLAAVAVTIVGGAFLGLKTQLSVGVFAGSLTTTPALAAATDITGNNTPAVGYSLGYPAGVVVGLIMVALFVSRQWPGKNDTPALSGQSLRAVTAVADKDINVREVPGWQEQKIRMSYLRSGDTTRVVAPGQILQKSDEVVVVGLPEDVERAVKAIGSRLHENLADDRSIVQFRSFIVSRPVFAGKTIAELSLASRFGAVATRIRRGDMEILAGDDKTVEVGDRLFVAFPREEELGIADYFGNSPTRVAQVDAVALGLGITMGVLLGMVSFSLPGGSTFSLGSAAGPLVVGMILGYLQRSGPLVWQLPQGTNLTLRQLGLLLFLAAVGITSGPAFMKTAPTPLGARAIILGVGVAIVTLLVMGLAGKLLGLSAPRSAGAMAGILGQPALLTFAQSRVFDERIEAGYVTIFALGIVLKIVLVSIILMF
ncbi:MAG: TrkA C-terminal domain-containing protein [Mobiluncus porci]|uniref:aspartate:alanine exchanger family transporter n=1 Tax=Mobiluncus TaxID=2050 RepID=UPI0012B26020|nr:MULTISPECIES: TrkA C-terminal domain-containing protein [Mobiluncus]MCI6583497.1 transporter [Mobiluncus sp.]MDD7540875.1 TrkA C-terminal domain-containing protein [Mobiluncus porci]MDY5748904.1 TrkA C-terminal domain-containing protein [Mobiluncus porci]